MSLKELKKELGEPIKRKRSSSGTPSEKIKKLVKAYTTDSQIEDGSVERIAKLTDKKILVKESDLV